MPACCAGSAHGALHLHALPAVSVCFLSPSCEGARAFCPSKCVIWGWMPPPSLPQLRWCTSGPRLSQVWQSARCRRHSGCFILASLCHLLCQQAIAATPLDPSSLSACVQPPWAAGPDWGPEIAGALMKNTIFLCACPISPSAAATSPEARVLFDACALLVPDGGGADGGGHSDADQE